MPAVLIPEPLVLAAERSVVAPLTISGLPERVEALGGRWQRKSEFHLTAIAARVLEPFEPRRPELWDLVERMTSARSLGPIAVGADVRRASEPSKPELGTLIVMAECPGLEPLYRELSAELHALLSPPPAHITLYSTDPDQGIGIVDDEELLERAPPLKPEEQETLRQAMGFHEVFGAPH
jgi:hypothetical protein